MGNSIQTHKTNKHTVIYVVMKMNQETNLPEKSCFCRILYWAACLDRGMGVRQDGLKSAASPLHQTRENGKMAPLLHHIICTRK